MAGEEEFDLEVEFSKFLADSQLAEVHAKVLDQTISLLRSMRHCYNLDTRDRENLDAIAATFVDVLSMLHCTAIRELKKPRQRC